jgi:hypothetical protein
MVLLLLLITLCWWWVMIWIDKRSSGKPDVAWCIEIGMVMQDDWIWCVWSVEVSIVWCEILGKLYLSGNCAEISFELFIT